MASKFEPLPIADPVRFLCKKIQESSVQLRDDARTKAQFSAFVHLKAFSEQSHLAAWGQRHQSVCPTLRSTRQFWSAPVWAWAKWNMNHQQRNLLRLINKFSVRFGWHDPLVLNLKKEVIDLQLRQMQPMVLRSPRLWPSVAPSVRLQLVKRLRLWGNLWGKMKKTSKNR